ncbi:hypothetical protein ACFYSF_22640 [Streptomyces canus]|uniref:hypothetical protein n=1 Tax=Streptomyces canus TaxID=58343 RepID=UPI00367CF1CF
MSERYLTRGGAEKCGQTHRDSKHEGMHPVNEAILTFDGGRMPQASEWKVFAIVAALLLLGLISKAI